MPDDLVRQSFLQHLYGIDLERQQRYRAYREYYDGEHSTQLTNRQRAYLQLKYGEDFRDNYCPVVVDALAERLELTGFDAGGQETVFWDWWKANRMDARQRWAHQAAIRDGDAFVMVEYDAEAGRPRFEVELAYDGSDGVKVHYSDERRGVVSFASKRWVISNPDEGAGKLRRINLYYPDRIEKYVSNSEEFEGDWRPYEDDDDGGWPVWNTTTRTEAGEPLGIPVIHFKYKSGGYDFGRSRMADAIPLQNALNKALIDIIGAADAEGFGLLYLFGDQWGDVTLGPGAVVKSEREASTVAAGRIPGGDLSNLLAHKNDLIMDIARISNTPLSRFQLTGHIASGATLKQQESGLVADAEAAQIEFGNAWEDVLTMGRKLHNAFGEGEQLTEDQLIESQWAPAATLDEDALVQRLATLSEKLNIPDVFLWRRWGMSAEEIEEAQADPQYQALRAGRLAMMDLASGEEDEG